MTIWKALIHSIFINEVKDMMIFQLQETILCLIKNTFTFRIQNSQFCGQVICNLVFFLVKCGYNILGVK